VCDLPRAGAEGFAIAASLETEWTAPRGGAFGRQGIIRCVFLGPARKGGEREEHRRDEEVWTCDEREAPCSERRPAV